MTRWTTGTCQANGINYTIFEPAATNHLLFCYEWNILGSLSVLPESMGTQVPPDQGYSYNKLAADAYASS